MIIDSSSSQQPIPQKPQIKQQLQRQLPSFTVPQQIPLYFIQQVQKQEFKANQLFMKNAKLDQQIHNLQKLISLEEYKNPDKQAEKVKFQQNTDKIRMDCKYLKADQESSVNKQKFQFEVIKRKRDKANLLYANKKAENQINNLNKYLTKLYTSIESSQKSIQKIKEDTSSYQNQRDITIRNINRIKEVASQNLTNTPNDIQFQGSYNNYMCKLTQLLNSQNHKNITLKNGNKGLEYAEFQLKQMKQHINQIKTVNQQKYRQNEDLQRLYKDVLEETASLNSVYKQQCRKKSELRLAQQRNRMELKLQRQYRIIDELNELNSLHRGNENDELQQSREL